MCSVADVKTLVSPQSLTDNDITSIITQATTEVANRARTSESNSDANLKTACIYTSAAHVLRKMKFSGELASSVKMGNSQQQNSIDSDIQAFEDLASRSIRMFLYSGASVPYGRVGPGTVNSTGTE